MSDISEPIALAQVEERILELTRLLEQATLAQKKRWIENSEAETAYAVSFGQAFLQAREGALPGQDKPDSDMTAKQRATVLCAEHLSRKNATHALLESAREAARNYRSALEGLRSINANVRSLTMEGE